MTKTDPKNVIDEKHFAIVDDTKSIRKMMRFTLKRIFPDSKIDCYENGELFLDNNNFNYDVIILDQNMDSNGGKLLGSEVAEILRTKRNYREKLILCSGNLELKQHNRHFNHVWSKPLPNQIAIREMLSSSGRKEVV